MADRARERELERPRVVTIRVWASTRSWGRCKKCGRPLQWFETQSDAWIPIHASAKPLRLEHAPEGGPRRRVVAVFDRDDVHIGVCPARRWRLWDGR